MHEWLGMTVGLSIAVVAAGCAPADAPVSCPDDNVVFEAQSVGANVLFLLDRSGSMHLPIDKESTRWSATKTALGEMFTELENRVGAAVTMFPAGDAPLSCCPVSDPNCGDCEPADLPGPANRCDASTYDEARLGLLTGAHIAELEKQIAASDDENYWGTPMAAALQGAVTALSAQSSPWQNAIVLLTDGKPTACELPEDPGANSIDLAVRAAERGTEVGVVTYVVGVVGAAEAADRAHMSAIARAGHSARYEGCAESDDCAYSVRLDHFQDDVHDALQAIARDTTSCTFTVGDASFDEEPYVDIIAGSQSTAVPRDGEHEDGWDWAGGGTIELYGNSCAVFKASPQARVQVRMPCAESVN